MVPLISVPSAPVFKTFISPLVLEIGAPSMIIPSLPALSIIRFPSLFSMEPLILIPFVPLFLRFILPFSFFKEPDCAR